MKHKHHSSKSRALLRRGIAIAGVGAVTAGAWAQPVIVTPPSLPASSEALGGDVNSDENALAASNLGFSPGPGLSFRWRKLHVRPRLSYEFLYGDGIRSSTNSVEKTTIQTISPGITVDIGEHWTLNYTPSLVFYSDSNFEDSLNHSFSLSGNTSYEDWNYGLNVGAGISSNPETETGQQTDQQNYSLSVSATRQLNDSLSMDLTAGTSFNLADEFNNSTDYHTMNWLNKQYGPNLGLGLGLGLGYEDVARGRDSLYEDIAARILWHIISKLDFSLSAGPQFRQYSDSGATTINPVYSGSLAYQVFEPTFLTFNASHSVGSSYFEDQLSESTTLSLGLNQRLLKRLSLGISGGYTFSSYQTTTVENETVREDSSTFFSINLGTSFLKRGSASVFYSHNFNDSDSSGFSYDSDQVGFTISYAY